MEQRLVFREERLILENQRHDVTPRNVRRRRHHGNPRPLQVAGIHNVLSKVFGNTNPVNVAKATMDALEQLTSVEEVQRLRGVSVRLFHPQAARPAGQPVPAAEEPDQGQ